MFPNKTKNFGRILFYAFVLMLPWQTRMIFTPEKSEFLTFSIYLSEIFLWLALAFWLTSADLKKIPSNPPLQKGETAKPPPFGKGRLGGIFLFSFFLFLSIAWSPDKVAAFRLWLFIFDGLMIYLYLKDQRKENPPQPSFFKGGGFPLCKRGIEGDFLFLFLFSLFIASLFGIWQFFNLGSPAWKWLGLGARGAWSLGDIVIATGGERWLRAYGPLPHPNIFGGYLAAGLIILFSLIKTTQSSRSYKMCGMYFLAATLFFALFLTFSRSAWLALAAASIYFVFEFYEKKRPTLTCAAAQVNANDKRENILKFFIFLSALALVFYGIFLPLVKTRIGAEGRLEQKSNTERIESWRDGLALWRENPIFGAGAGNYTVGFPKPYSRPPHNIFILVLSQLGLAGFVIYFFVWKNFWKNPAVRPLLILFFVIGIFDHYLWTLWSGQMLFWVGIVLTDSENCDNL